MDEVWPVDKADWFRIRHQEWIDAWNAGPERRELSATLQVSEVGDVAVYLLNPLVVAPDGEWQAWFFSNWNPGADRYRSFQEMMEAQHKHFLFVRGHRRPSAPWFRRLLDMFR